MLETNTPSQKSEIDPKLYRPLFLKIPKYYSETKNNYEKIVHVLLIDVWYVCTIFPQYIFLLVVHTRNCTPSLSTSNSLLELMGFVGVVQQR